ncbi:ProQ/FINO family protein [Aliivibrio salmonicida]
MGIKNQRYQDCKIWICSRWPAMFDRDNVKPLALGIYRDIAIKHKEDGGFEVLGFGAAVPVKRFLSAWVKRKAYQRALSQSDAQRFNLLGESVSSVSEEDQLHAIKRIKLNKK